MPKLKGLTFETSIIERYKRRETSVEEALIEMYLAGVSVRRVEDISEALWGTKVSPGTISNLNKKAYGHIEEWRNRKLTVEYVLCYPFHILNLQNSCDCGIVVKPDIYSEHSIFFVMLEGA